MPNDPKPKSRLEIARDVYRESHPWQYPKDEDDGKYGCAMAFCILMLAYTIIGCIVAHFMKP